MGDFGDVDRQNLIDFIAQIFAVHYLRKHRTDLERPFKAWFYPVPNAIAFFGWSYIFVTSGWGFILFGLLTLAAGVVAFWLWRRRAGLPVFFQRPSPTPNVLAVTYCNPLSSAKTKLVVP